MSTTTRLPGFELAREVLGLDNGEIARAVQADESTLYRWRQGSAPTAIYMSRLERLDDLAREIQRTMRREAIPAWLDRPIPAVDGRTAREMILAGRSETLLGMLISLNAGFSL
jgi:hypothetical protein